VLTIIQIKKSEEQTIKKVQSALWCCMGEVEMLWACVNHKDNKSNLAVVQSFEYGISHRIISIGLRYSTNKATEMALSKHESQLVLMSESDG
jgi:hypothetical protein